MPSISRKQVPPKKIGLFGGFGFGNSGNEGSLEAMLIFLRQFRPDADLVCICPVPDEVRKDHGISAISFSASSSGTFIRFLNRLLFRAPSRLANWIHAITELLKLDLLIIPGTGILDDFNTGPWSFPYVLFRWCLSARLCGTELWFVSIGAGPIHHPVSRRLMKWAAAMAQYRSYRDTISKEFMESIGLDAHSDPIYPDLAFKLPGPQRSRPQGSDAEVLTVAFGVMNYGGWRSDLRHQTDIVDEYIKKVTRFLAWLLDRGYRVRILTGDRFDQPAIDYLVGALAGEGQNIPSESLVIEPTLTLYEVMQQIALTDIVVATRFHNVVCALKLGRPTISVGYADKNDALLADMGLAGFCQHIEKLDVELLIEQFITLAADRHEHARRIKTVVQAYQQRLAEQDAFLASRLLPGM
jgi:polysaccharide pyruvyl transferase WcaK-like protein